NYLAVNQFPQTNAQPSHSHKLAHCCRYWRGGSIAACANRPNRWTSSSTAWSGMDCLSHKKAQKAQKRKFEFLSSHGFARKVSSLCTLCVLCVSVVNDFAAILSY